MIKQLLVVLLACLLPAGLPLAAARAPPNGAFIEAAAWNAYKAHFLDASGRIVDTANGGISHSEGQGYGLLLSCMANDLPAFEAIWTFTKTQMLLRDDGLAAWKWDPNHTPHVSDINNATDGDILIAYALARAAEHWHRTDFRSASATIVAALARRVLIRHDGRRLLLPAATGFSAKERADGPVVNLSYWIFEAFPVFARLDPDSGWKGLARDGRTLLANAAFGSRGLPPDWLSLKTAPTPASGFPDEFGYNAIRIPLYLVRAKAADTETLKHWLGAMTDENGDLVTVDLSKDSIESRLTDPGYRAIPALVRCALDHTALPAEVRSFTPTDYYPSTLHLLALATIAEQGLRCGAP